MLFKKELFVTLNREKFNEVTAKLRAANISYRTRIVDNNLKDKMNRTIMPPLKESMSYYVYVSKKDLQQAIYIINKD